MHHNWPLRGVGGVQGKEQNLQSSCSCYWSCCTQNFSHSWKEKENHLGYAGQKSDQVIKIWAVQNGRRDWKVTGATDQRTEENSKMCTKTLRQTLQPSIQNTNTDVTRSRKNESQWPLWGGLSGPHKENCINSLRLELVLGVSNDLISCINTYVNRRSLQGLWGKWVCDINNNQGHCDFCWIRSNFFKWKNTICAKVVMQWLYTREQSTTED